MSKLIGKRPVIALVFILVVFLLVSWLVLGSPSRSDYGVNYNANDTGDTVVDVDAKDYSSNAYEFSPDRPLILSLIDGSTASYRLIRTLDGWVNMAPFMGMPVDSIDLEPGDYDPFTLSADAVLHLKFYPDASEGWRVAVKPEFSGLLINNAASDKPGQYEHPFAFLLSNRGTIGRFIFNADLSDEVRDFYTQILLSTQMPLPKGYRTDWIAREYDTQGAVTARYSVSPGSMSDLIVEKVRVGYQATKPLVGLPASVNANLRSTIEESSATYWLTTDGSWFKKLSMQELFLQHGNQGPFSEVQSTIELEKLGASTNSDFPASWEAFLALVQSTEIFTNSFYDTDPYLDSLANGKNIESAVEFFAYIERDILDRPLAVDFAINYIRKHPEQSIPLVDILNRANTYLTDQEEAMLWYALARAGHEEAQAALVWAASQSNHLPSTRTRALMSMHNIEQPTSSTVTDVSQLYRQEQGSELGNLSLLSLGSFARNQSTPQAQDQLTQDVIALSRSESEDIELILGALQNTANPMLLDIATPLLRHAESVVRVAAYEALGNLEPATVFQVLADSYAQQEEEAVRLAALYALESAGLTAQANDWVITQLEQTHGNPQERELSSVELIGLAGRLLEEYPANMQVLKSIAMHNQTPLALRREALRYVTP